MSGMWSLKLHSVNFLFQYESQSEKSLCQIQTGCPEAQLQWNMNSAMLNLKSSIAPAAGGAI